MSSNSPPTLALCMGSEDGHYTNDDSIQACSVAGTFLVVSSGLGTFFCIISLSNLIRRQRTVPIDRRIKILDLCARNSFVCGILHLCVCLCWWMILRRTPFYYIIEPLFIGIIWIFVGRYMMKWSDKLHDINRSSQLLVNLLATENQRDDDADINAPSGLFLVGPEDGFGRYEADAEDLEAPDIDSSSDDSEDGKMKVAQGVQVSDVSDDDLESFEDEDEGYEHRNEDFNENIPITDDPIEVVDDDDEQKE
jgi:hypothetical protein